jgi:hypothetical protein
LSAENYSASINSLAKTTIATEYFIFAAYGFSKQKNLSDKTSMMQ